MRNFFDLIAKLGLLIAVAICICLIAVGYLLLFKPKILLQILQYGLGVLCVISGVALAIYMLVAFFKYKASSKLRESE